MALAICTACYKISVISFSKLMDIDDNKNQFYEFIHDTNDEWNIIFLKLKSVVATCIFYVKTASELSFLALTHQLQFRGLVLWKNWKDINYFPFLSFNEKNGFLNIKL